jgi:hypothetical protein
LPLTQPLQISADTRRLFPGLADADLDPTRGGGSLLIARLLEDGDRHDLAWLCSAVPEAALGAWLERRGARQLSRRSRAFWEVVLGRTAGGWLAETDETAETRDTAAALWPL